MSLADNPTDTRAGSTSMVVAAHRGGVEVVEHLADEWRDLCKEAVDDQPFYRPEWIAAHIRAFAPQAKVVLLTVRSEGKLLFVLPLVQEWSVFAGVPLRKLRGPVNSHAALMPFVTRVLKEMPG
jgi:CelD/BcsL family acetyltransferase involved in cellulose biosynthesis